MDGPSFSINEIPWLWSKCPPFSYFCCWVAWWLVILHLFWILPWKPCQKLQSQFLPKINNLSRLVSISSCKIQIGLSSLYSSIFCSFFINSMCLEDLKPSQSLYDLVMITIVKPFSLVQSHMTCKPLVPRYFWKLLSLFLGNFWSFLRNILMVLLHSQCHSPNCPSWLESATHSDDLFLS